MGFLSQLFTHWRGDIIFRFRVVASPYHRGRLLIAFDPAGDSTNNLNNTSDPSTIAFSQVVDISETQEVEMRIPYAQASTFLQTARQDKGSTASYVLPNSGTSWPISINTVGTYNGMFSVTVLNGLTAPVDTSTVKILVFVRGAENLEFANPVNPPSEMSILAPQSEEVSIAETENNFPDIYRVNFGEPVRSLRQIIHRYTLCEVYRNTTAYTTPTIITRTFKRMPYFRGYDTTGYTQANGTLDNTTTKKYLFMGQHPLTYISQCFLGLRGSTNILVNTTGNGPTVVRAMRIPEKNGEDAWAVTNLTGTPGLGQAMSEVDNVYNTSGGAILSSQVTRQGTVFNMPDCSGVNFEPTYSSCRWSVSGALDYSYKQVQIAIFGHGSNTTSSQYTRVEVYKAAGVDMQFLYFLNAPLLYCYATPTATASP